MRVHNLGVLMVLWVFVAQAQEPAADAAAPPPADTTPASAPAPASEPAATQSAPAESPPPADAALPPTIPVAEAPPPEPAPAAKSEAVMLDTVEVTAQRRREKLQEVPIAVTAMTRDQIESRGITRLDELNSLAPGLQISRSPSNTTISQITIRGSSQINPAIYWDPAVGVYLDGAYIGKSQGAIFDIVDLAGVEVLRGPQGTLYGRNTIGGTINFRTREPEGVFSGNGSLEYGSYRGRVARASIDLPRLGIADMVIGARTERRDGWVTTAPTSSVSELNNRHNDGLHFAANLDLLPGVEGIYRFDYDKADQTNTFDQLYRSDNAQLQPYVSQQRQTHADVNAPSFERYTIQGHSFTLAWEVVKDNFLKAITGYRKVDWADSLDLDGSPVEEAFTQRYTSYKQFSEDLNFTGASGNWKYVAGIFYFTDDGYTNNPQHFKNDALNFDSQYGTHTKAWAGYGQLDWRIFAPLTLTGGLRYTSETKNLDRVFGTSPLPPAFLAQIPAAVQASLPAAAGNGFIYYMPPGYHTADATFTGVTPLISVAWKFSESANVYARYAEGFKSGGYNGEFSSLTDTPQTNQDETNTPFKPEKQKSLEFGSKNSFFGGRALLNLALFQNKLIDLQIPTFTGQGAAATVVRNAGKATVKGVEVETAVIPFEGTTLRANYAYLNAKYDEFLEAGNNVAADRAFVHAPKNSYNVVLDSALLQRGWGTLRAVVDYVWTDSFYTYPYQLGKDPNTVPTQQKQEAENSKVKAYGLLNARLALSGIPLGGSASAELALWGRNLTDNATANNFIDFGPGLFQNLTVVNFVEPRTCGISAVLRW